MRISDCSSDVCSSDLVFSWCRKEPTMQKDSHQREMHGALASLTPPSGAAEDWTVPQRWDELTAEDHWVWDTLFARQQTLLHGRAVEAFERGLDMQIGRAHV